MNQQRSRDRVRISNHNIPILEALGDSSKNPAVFRIQARAIAFAATVGYHFNQFEPFQGQLSKAILFQQIDTATELGSYLDSVFALAHTENISVLMDNKAGEDPDEDFNNNIAWIFEGYVNGGLGYLRNYGMDLTNPIETVLNLMDTLNPKDSGMLRRKNND